MGFVAFIRFLTKGVGGSKSKRIEFLDEEIADLTQVVKKSPNKKASELLLDYVKELETLKGRKIPLVEITPGTKIQATQPVQKPAVEEEGRIIEEKTVKKVSLEEDLSKFWENWYSDNSINLLLYIGAFLIVASASIFIGFQWETIGGTIKASLMSLLTLAFFGFGAWFYSVSKIKNAGATFIAIAAILIPFNGAAWYNFVFGPSGYTVGSVWLITSLVAIVVYASLAYFIRHPFYTYIAGFGGLSITLSIVNVSQFNQEFYILGGMFSAFVLLLSTRLIASGDEKNKGIFATPLSISAHVIMPISLIWGLLLASSLNQLFSLEMVVAAFLASLYYLIAYSFARDISFLAISQVLFPISIFLFGKWGNLSDILIYNLIQSVAIAYLVTSHYLKRNWAKEAESVFTTSQLVLPISFLLVTATLFSNNDLFTLGTVVSISLATLFYLLSYLINKKVVFAYTAEALFLVGIYVIGRCLDYTPIQIYYVLEIIFFIYLLGSYYVSFNPRKDFQELSESLTIIPLIFAAWLFSVAFGSNIAPFHLTAFAVFPTVLGLITAYFQKNNIYFFYNFFFLAVTVYLYFNNLLGLEHKPYFMGSAYVGISLIFYLITLSTKEIKSSFQAFSIATVSFAALGFIFTVQEPGYFLLSNITAGAILLDYAIRFKKYEYIYFSNLFIFVGLWSVLRVFDMKLSYYPLFFAGLSYLFYIVSQVLPDSMRNFYRLTALVGTGANTLLFGWIGQSSSIGSSRQTYMELERNALITSYASFFLYNFDASIIKKSSLGYFASAVGMLTYLWQMNYLGFSETQVYTLPLGVYFMTLAYLQRMKGSLSNQDLLNYVGLLILLVPTFMQSFEVDGAKYALLLGVEGIVIFSIGNSLAYRNYIYVGIGAIVIAVITQTYEFVFSLPWWVLTAIAGLLFLSTAIYLLLNRKEEPK